MKANKYFSIKEGAAMLPERHIAAIKCGIYEIIDTVCHHVDDAMGENDSKDVDVKYLNNGIMNGTSYMIVQAVIRFNEFEYFDIFNADYVRKAVESVRSETYGLTGHPVGYDVQFGIQGIVVSAMGYFNTKVDDNNNYIL